ncbi:MAG: hypothetical protein V3T17_02330 [Pseudomonadales bacterium]
MYSTSPHLNHLYKQHCPEGADLRTLLLMADAGVGIRAPLE